MNTKTSLISIAVYLLFSVTALGQTIPFGFKNPKSQLLKGLPQITFKVQQKDKDGKVTGDSTMTQDVTYETISTNLQEMADNIREEAAQDFANGVLDLGSPKTVADLKTYEVKFENLEGERNAQLKDALLFEKKAKAFKYLHRISDTWTPFPVRNAVDAEMYYNGTVKDSRAKFLSNTLIAFSSDGGRASVFNEIYADYLDALRLGLGAMISNKQQVSGEETVHNKEEKREDAMQRLLGGGGNGVLSLSYPLLNVDNGQGFAIKLGVAPKMGVDIPKIGTENNDFAVNYNLGAEGAIFYSGALDVFTLYSTFRFARIGGNGLFFSNLEKTDNKSFGFNQISFGIGISSTFRLGYSHYFGSDFVNKNFPGAISFTIIPN